MIKPAMCATQDYGTTGICIASSAVRRAQSNVAEARGHKAAGAPSFLAIQWHLGPTADPALAEPTLI